MPGCTLIMQEGCTLWQFKMSPNDSYCRFLLKISLKYRYHPQIIWMHDIQRRMEGTENKLRFSHVQNIYLNTYALIYIKISPCIWNTHSTHMKSKGDFENWGRDLKDLKEQGLGKKRFHTYKLPEVMSLLEPLVGSWVRIYFKRHWRHRAGASLKSKPKHEWWFRKAASLITDSPWSTWRQLHMRLPSNCLLVSIP